MALSDYWPFGSNGAVKSLTNGRTKGQPVLQNGSGVPSSKLAALNRASAQLSHDVTQADFDHSHGTHPIRQLTQDLHGAGVQHESQLILWHLMREFVPVLDAAIQNRRHLEGTLVIESEDEGLQEALRDFWYEVPVGYMGNRASLTGGDTYLNMLAENADEYGLGVGEALLDQGGRGIRRLVVPNARTIQAADRDADGIHELYQAEPDMLERGDADIDQINRLDNRPTVNVLAFRPSTESEWPYPVAWSLKQVATAFLRIISSQINGWWRFGDPSMHFSIEFDPETHVDTVQISQGEDDDETGDQVTVPGALVWLKDGMSQVMDARREGKVGDMYSYAEGGEISQEVIGNIDATLMQYVREHKGEIAAQVIEQTATPPWMYPSVQQQGDGLGSKRSLAMAKFCDDAASDRNKIKLQEAREVLDLWLTVTGSANFIGEYTLDFRRLGIVDEQMQAEADRTRQEAEQLALQNVGVAFDENGERRFGGLAEDYLEREGIYQSEE